MMQQSHHNVRLSPITHPFKGSFFLPGDKSISHRVLLFAALASGPTTIHHLSDAIDVRSTFSSLSQLGAEWSREDNRLTCLQGLPKGRSDVLKRLDCGNSGTTMRLCAGLLAGREGAFRLTGDGSLISRPMERIAKPLSLMGASISLQENGCAPIDIMGAALHGITYELPIASAQVKSAILLAGLQADGKTSIKEHFKSRDHTERLLSHFGCHIDTEEAYIDMEGKQELQGCDVKIPGDFSSAAVFLAVAAMIPGSDIRLCGISLNPTRTGFVDVLRRMGGELDVHIDEHEPEPMGSIHLTYSDLSGTDITADEIPLLIDEIPLLAVIASTATGRTTVSGASELRHKESDRIEQLAVGLRKMGIEIEVFEDGFMIDGPQSFSSAVLHSAGDHRLAMAFSIALICSDQGGVIQKADCVRYSYPHFYQDLARYAHI